MIVQNGQVVGSRLIGQSSQQPGDFHSRPSAAGSGYDALASGGTNLGPANPKLREGASDDPATANVDESFAGVRQLARKFRLENELSTTYPVPIDAVTRSGSGLDPHISLANAACKSPGWPGNGSWARKSPADRAAAHRGPATRVPRIAEGLGARTQPRAGRVQRACPPSPRGRDDLDRSSAAMRWLEYTAFLAIVVLLAKPLGLYLSAFSRAGEPSSTRSAAPGGGLYRLLGVVPGAR